jgi:hypothetical protein
MSRFLYRSRLALWRGEDHPDLDDPPQVGPEFGGLVSGEFRETLRTRELADAYKRRLEAAGEAAEPGSRRRALFYQLNAEIFAYVFEIDGALAAVRGAIDAGLLDLLWMDLCPVLDPVRKDARFPPLREEVAVRVQAVRAAMREA